MVRVTTLRYFYDLKCHVDRNVGDTFDASEGRAEQLDSALPGYIAYERLSQDRVTEPECDGTEEDLSGMTVSQLKERARDLGITIPSGSKKADIIAILKG
jgi:hypothetical protein